MHQEQRNTWLDTPEKTAHSVRHFGPCSPGNEIFAFYYWKVVGILTWQSRVSGLGLPWAELVLACFLQLPSGQATPLQPVWAPAVKIQYMVNFWQPDVATVQWSIALYGGWGWGKLLHSAEVS